WNGHHARAKWNRSARRRTLSACCSITAAEDHDHTSDRRGLRSPLERRAAALLRRQQFRNFSAAICLNIPTSTVTCLELLSHERAHPITASQVMHDGRHAYP